MSLPDLNGFVSVKDAVLVPPGAAKPVIHHASLISHREMPLIIGPSGAGKSTLVRGILGLWKTASGEIRIDGAEAYLYARDELGPQIGYLPQDIALEGSVSSNICRFGEMDPEAVVEAAKASGVHEMILSLSNGYDTQIE